MKIHVFTLIHAEVGIIAQVITTEHEAEMGHTRLIDKYNSLHKWEKDEPFTLENLEQSEDLSIDEIAHTI